MASPLPTSSTSSHASPGWGAGGAIAKSGAIQIAPAERSGKPRGASNHAAPTIAAATVHAAGSCVSSVAKALDASASSGTMVISMTQCAASRSTGSGRNAPAMVSGTTARLTTGMANALARGETSDTCWKSATIIGIIASVTASCSTKAAWTFPGVPARRATA